MNQPPVQSAFDLGGKPNSLWVMWVNLVQSILQGVQNTGSSDYVTPLTGFSYQCGASIEVVTFDPAGTILAGAATLPASPFNGQRVLFNTTQEITTFTVAASTGNSLSTTYAAKLAANTGIGYYFNQSQNKWYRLF